MLVYKTAPRIVPLHIFRQLNPGYTATAVAVGNLESGFWLHLLTREYGIILLLARDLADEAADLPAGVIELDDNIVLLRQPLIKRAIFPQSDLHRYVKYALSSLGQESLNEIRRIKAVIGTGDRGIQ
jgi:hypothetical protein